MTKSTTIIFILFFAILFGLEKKVCALDVCATRACVCVWR